MKLSLSILIPTYNRAEILRESLEAMCKVERNNLSAEFVVIDNNSTDNTRKVVESFTDKLPLRYLFESAQGKSHALNRVLNEGGLGEIVVLTDDDTTPRSDWLSAIAQSVRDFPDHVLFGGRTFGMWPGGKHPGWWDNRPGASHWCLGNHDYGDKPREYPSNLGPFGPNMWIRREALTKEHRFDVTIGPLGDRMIMGEEWPFIQGFRAEGHNPLYYPDAVVGQRIQPERISRSGIRKRAYAAGLGGPHMNGPCRRELFDRHPAAWLALRLAALGWAALRLVCSQMSLSDDLRIRRSLSPICDIAYNLEAVSLYFGGRYIPQKK
ncbi:MAG: glycosyltransferase family A protein [Sedimentisphaerales bacterium]